MSKVAWVLLENENCTKLTGAMTCNQMLYLRQEPFLRTLKEKYFEVFSV